MALPPAAAGGGCRPAAAAAACVLAPALTERLAQLRALRSTRNRVTDTPAMLSLGRLRRGSHERREGAACREGADALRRRAGGRPREGVVRRRPAALAQPPFSRRRAC